MDRNVVHKSKKFHNLCLKRENKKAKDTSVEIQKYTSEIDSMLNASSCSKADFSIQDQFNSDLTPPKQPKLNLSDDEKPPKDFSLFDATQQVQIEEHMKQHLAE